MILLLLILTLLGQAALAIDQVCPCPANSNCLSNDMCACNLGFIGNCNVAAPLISETPSTITLLSGVNSLFQIQPNNLSHYLQFTFQLCLNQPMVLTFTLYGETGDTTTYDLDNQLGNSITNSLTSGCTLLTTPYISFGTQPNGLNDELVIGIFSPAPTTQATVSVSQKLIIGVFLYYYILIAITAIVAIVIAVGIGVFIYRQRLRNRAGPIQPATAVPRQYNDIDHFQNFMPMFAADKLGNDRSICPICLQQIEAAEVVRQTPCYHIFHSSCLDSWGLKNMSCPVCRSDLSFFGLAHPVSSRIRNSSIHMDIPPEDDDWIEEQPMPQRLDVLVQQQEDTPRPPPVDSEKYEIRENML